MTKTSFTYVLSKAQQETLIHIIRHGNYLPVTVEHCIVAADAGKCRICLYKSGKCLVQGKEAADFVTFVLEPQVLGAVSLGYEDILNPEAIQPHMGVDESGKGDFFGPIVIASAYVDSQLAPVMREMDVKDSKRITSDTKAIAMGRELRRILGNRFSVITIGPRAYNRLYSRMRNVNTLLAWGHARAIENLLNAVPDCPRALSDQFGNERLIKNALMKKGRAIKLEQRHKAESDLAVAAASIIAREQFLLSLRSMAENFGTKIPKGASDAVRSAAVGLVKQKGPGILLDIAKCHFKTADQVLQEAGASRRDLGEEGQSVSRPFAGRWNRGKSSGSTPDSRKAE